MTPEITALVIQVEHELRDEDGKVSSRRMVQMAPIFQSKIPPDVLAWIDTLQVVEPQR